MYRRLLRLDPGSGVDSILKIKNWSLLKGTNVDFKTVHLQMRSIQQVYPVPCFSSTKSIFIDESDSTINKILNEYTFPMANTFYIRNNFEIISVLQKNFYNPLIYSNVAINETIKLLTIKEFFQLLEHYEIKVEI